MFRISRAASALAVIAACAAIPSSADEKSAWRLFVSDHAAPVVNAIDAATGEKFGSFSLKSPASLYASDSGRTVFAVQRDSNVVSAIATGISVDDHGDHGDIEIAAPELLDAEIAGKKPVHFVDHHGDIALFFDDEGVARIFSEKAAVQGQPPVREIKTASPHHGVAIAFGEHVLMTEPHAQKPVEELPVGIRVLDKSDAQVGNLHECPDLHGEATSGNLTAIACAKGLLIAKSGNDGPQIDFLAYPDDLPDGKSTTLAGGRGLQYFLGNFGPSAVVLIDPEAENAFRLIELPARRVHFAVDPVRPKFAYVFTEDGRLHQVDVLSGTIVKSLTLTEPYSMDGHWSDPRPRIAVAGPSIFVTDPLKSTIHIVDAASFAKASDIPLEGKPFNIVAVSGSGEVHDQEGGQEHAHSHEHNDDQIYNGYFEDNQVKDRTLSDWAGDWQSVYPYLKDGTLDPVMALKAKSGDKSVDEHQAYYEIGYRTNVERIKIHSDTVTFFEGGKPLEARYVSDGYEILTYKKGNRGVRFIFRKTEGDAAAPKYIQFSDHKIAPEAADHYHLYWGNDRAALLEEVTNWPTYYPSSLSAKEIVEEMMAH